MGVNVHLRQDELPVPTATSLALLRPDATHVRNELILTVLTLLELWLGRWETGIDDAGVRNAYAERCSSIGRRVEVQVPTGPPVRGTASGIDADGRLVLETPEGEQTFGAGDVVHLR
jgi:BirA family biotin operon repressor/biotin-[acetyl-CoA-carboxylase] ligase